MFPCVVNILFDFQFDLQWLMIHCDPSKPERESCDEIPVSQDTQKSVSAAVLLSA